jgi:aspartyl aminopeptidase
MPGLKNNGGSNVADKKTKGQLLEEQLLVTKKSCFKTYAAKISAKLDGYIAGYMKFMNSVKTEREFIREAIVLLEKNGFSAFDRKKAYAPGEKCYFDNRGRSLIACVMGQRLLEEGLCIMAAHIDSPRLDLKPNPLYEDSELGYFKTHYYGGIKKNQWAAIPLAIHGVVVKKDGTTVDIVVGESEDDPVFCITDILPHLAAKVQGERKSRDVLRGEELNILLGSEPLDDKEVKSPVKLNIMRLLHEKYGIDESDFVSAEIEVVPALRARYIGFDKSLIGAYAHDDRVCAYAGLTALIDTPVPTYTALCVLADKEEVGSGGNTGLESDMLRNFLAVLSRNTESDLETVIHNATCVSADVNAAYDPNFGEVHEKRNAAYLNYGPVVTKYTGAYGKVSTNDASAEFMARVRALLDEAGVPWQTGELGRVDEGGGGTVAKDIANLGIEVVDVGVPLLSMHAPYEVASCLDIYAMYDAFCAYIK